MVFVEGYDDRRKEKRKGLQPLKRTLNTAKEYAENTTLHGFAYVANSEHPRSARVLWLLVVVAAIALATYQMATLREQWQTNPVTTTLDSIALPIENIEFPAVTICPQGSVKDILNNVMMKQLIEYIENKTETHRSTTTRFRRETPSLPSPSNMTYKGLMGHVKDFLHDVYPGAKKQPTDFVTMLTKDNPKQAVENKAVILPNQDEKCDASETEKIVHQMNKNLNRDFCPDGFTSIKKIGCVMVISTPMTYTEASGHCRDVGGAAVIKLDSYEQIKALDEHNLLGNYKYILNICFMYI
jgi:hypothetical protein